MKCKNCVTDIRQDDKFCPDCGPDLPNWNQMSTFNQTTTLPKFLIKPFLCIILLEDADYPP